MVDDESLKSAVPGRQCEDSAKPEQTAAAVILRSFCDWMLRTFVPVPSLHGKVSKVRSSASVRGTSSNSTV
jgi:hypothetical protein